MEELQERIGIAFRDSTLLQEALTHSSFANESPHISPRDNERLEYLGDAVLQLITAEYLYKYRPAANEGELTQTRSSMVNTNTLAALSEDLGVGEHLYLGKGIAKGGGRSLRSLLANAFEAILGAIFLDAGYDAAYHYYLDRFRRLPEPVRDENHKGRLQQVVQERFNQTPYYDSAGARGTGHRREYTAVVFAGSEALGTGHGPTKQEAEQDAASKALARLLGRAPVESATPREARDAVPSRSGRGRGRARSPERAEAVTPSEVTGVLQEQDSGVAALEAQVQAPPAPEMTLPEPVATPAIGGPAVGVAEAEAVAVAEPEAEPAKEARPRRRRSPSRRKVDSAAEAGRAEVGAPAPETAPAPEAVPSEAAPAPETAPAPEAVPSEARPRRRRTPARGRTAGTAEPSEPRPEPPPAVEPPAPPSRQFGQPLD